MLLPREYTFYKAPDLYHYMYLSEVNFGGSPHMDFLMISIL